ncbi:MAG: hypothetical protein IIB07_10530 [Bacteroidetes bacterium]|nr:hypothetical protein [Bacteroidota bacterium]
MLKNEGKKIFDEFKGYLERHSTFEMSDEFNLTELAMYFQIFYEASRILSVQDLVVVYPNKQMGVNPHYKVMIDASKQIRSLALKMGIYDVMKDKLRQYGKITTKSKEFLK